MAQAGGACPLRAAFCCAHRIWLATYSQHLVRNLENWNKPPSQEK